MLTKYIVKLAGRDYFVLAPSKVSAYNIALASHRRTVGDHKVSPLSEGIRQVG